MDRIQTEMEKHNVLRLSNQESNHLTRECLETALIRLLADKELEKISITELVRLAGVSRTAFYSNYSSKEDILASWMSQVGDELIDLIWPYVLKDDLSGMFRQLFQKIKEDHHQVEILVKAGLPHRLSAALEATILKKDPPRDRKKQYAITGYCGMLNNILMEWYRGAMKETAEEMSEICCALFLPRQ